MRRCRWGSELLLCSLLLLLLLLCIRSSRSHIRVWSVYLLHMLLLLTFISMLHVLLPRASGRAVEGTASLSLSFPLAASPPLDSDVKRLCVFPSALTPGVLCLTQSRLRHGVFRA